MYALLVKAYRDGKADFSKAHFFSLDEYAGLGKADKSSFSHYLLHHFFGKVNAKKENIRLLDGAAGDLKVECARHEAAIKKKGIDLFILGIGRNGHVAFNEPGSGEHSATCVVNLSRQTRRVNGKGFPKGLAPERALTVGLGTIRENSGNILLLASGGHKKGAVSALLAGGNPAKCPAAALRTHKNFMVVADGAAAGKKAK
jgi:glucosamine-6-phosphate deaminase